MFRRRLIASSVALLLASTDVMALGLGGLRTQSALNQPFMAEIELFDVRPDELDGVKVSIASAEDFARVGTERFHHLTQLNFLPQLAPDGRSVIRVSSREPMREPFLDFLVEAVWSGGRLVRGYTVLLDPPTTQRLPAPAARQTTADTARTRIGDPERPPAPVAAPGAGFPMQFGPVRPGQGLWRLAVDGSPPGATVAQTAMALYRNNQPAFIGTDINRLRQGRTLVIPSRGELFALTPAEAERDFRAALRGETVRRTPLTQVPLMADTGEEAEGQLRIAGRVEPVAAPPETGTVLATDTLQAPPDTRDSEVQRDLLLVMEASESTRQEAAELRDRVRELESQLTEIQLLLQLRNAELARLQRTDDLPIGSLPSASDERVALAPIGAPPDEDASALDWATGLAISDDPALDRALLEDDLTSAVATPDDPALLDALPAEIPGIAEAPAIPEEVAPEETIATAPTPTPTDTLGQIDRPTPAESSPDMASDRATDVPSPSPSTDTSTWHALLLPLAGVAGVTALGVILFSWLAARRRRAEDEAAEEEAADTASAATGSDRKATPPPADTATSTAKTDEEDTQETSFTLELGQTSTDLPSSDALPSSQRLPSEDSFDLDVETDAADALSEADIYIAYGRFQEACKILLKELERFPERIELKLKLAEVHAGAGDATALRKLVREIEIEDQSRLDPASWMRLLEMLAQVEAGASPASIAQTSPDTPLSPPFVTPSQGGDGGAAASSDLRLDESATSGGDLELPELSEFEPQALDAIAPDRADGDTSTRAALPEFDLDTLEDSGTARRLDTLSLDKATDAGSELLLPDSGTGTAPGRDSSRLASASGDLAIEDSGTLALLRELDAQLGEHEESMGDSILTLDELATELEDPLADLAMPPPAPAGAKPLEHTGDALQASEPPPSLRLPDSTLDSAPTDALSSQWQADSGVWDETATKLDLARAYLEMEDAEAALGILEEVLAEGNEAQRQEAAALLKQNR